MENIHTTYNIDITGGLLGCNWVHEFLVFMETDSSGAIGLQKNKHIISIKSLLDKKPFALNYYKEFIKKSKVRFPSYDLLIQLIDDIKENTFNPFNNLHTDLFCQRFWGAIWH
jgi:hypothetical protein